MVRVLSRDQAIAFYDRFGSRQDSQAFYEDAASARLLEHGDFAQARSVLEFGCGTGRLALRFLTQELPGQARYRGLDLSRSMVGLALARLAPFRERASVQQSDGSVRLPVPEQSCDRVVSTYVTDLLSEADSVTLLEEAHRVLKPDGRLCLAGITHGTGVVTRLVSWAWSRIHALRPAWLGGCRPTTLLPLLTPLRWTIAHSEVVAAWGVSSEVIVAIPRKGRSRVRSEEG